jgi:zinc transporter 2
MFKLLHSHHHHHKDNHEHEDITELVPIRDRKESAHSHHHHHHERNVNIRAAMLHVIGDFIQSIGVVIAASVIYFRPDWRVADPLCTLVFAVIVGFTTVPIIKECMEVIMEATPLAIDIAQLKKDFAAIVGVREVHDLHVWSLTVGKLSLSVHLISELSVETLEAAVVLCKTKYGLTHTTIQVEVLKNHTSSFNCSSELH